MSGSRRHFVRNVAIAIATLAVLGGGAALLLARRWFWHKHTPEAVHVVGAIARAAVAAYEREQPDGTHRLCPSATQPVPADRPRNKYLSSSEEWSVDRARSAGFACLGFELTTPQYCQYGYEDERDAFVAWGRCDYDEDGVVSEYRLRFHLAGGELRREELQVSNEDE